MVESNPVVKSVKLVEMSYTKFIHNIIIVALMPLFFFSCDKMDYNGHLDGQWQMTEWLSPTGEVIGNNEMQIYYSFQLQMMMFQRLSISSGQQRSLYEYTGTSIRIYSPIQYEGNGHDKILPMDVLSRYGVPSDGIMKIEYLSAGKLVLSSSQTGQLTFRKY